MLNSYATDLLYAIVYGVWFLIGSLRCALANILTGCKINVFWSFIIPDCHTSLMIMVGLYFSSVLLYSCMNNSKSRLFCSLSTTTKVCKFLVYYGISFTKEASLLYHNESVCFIIFQVACQSLKFVLLEPSFPTVTG